MLNEVIVLNSESMGSGDEPLGKLLMGNVLRLLASREDKPKYIILYNAAVKLATIASPVLDYLLALQEHGVMIISCRTCLEYFGIEDKLAVGEIQGMVEILNILSAHNVLTI